MDHLRAMQTQQNVGACGHGRTRRTTHKRTPNAHIRRRSLAQTRDRHRARTWTRAVFAIT
eukprot:5435613-Lingulodinium_polyedra.AAC.1